MLLNFRFLTVNLSFIMGREGGRDGEVLGKNLGR